MNLITIVGVFGILLLVGGMVFTNIAEDTPTANIGLIVAGAGILLTVVVAICMLYGWRS